MVHLIPVKRANFPPDLATLHLAPAGDGHPPLLLGRDVRVLLCRGSRVESVRAALHPGTQVLDRF